MGKALKANGVKYVTMQGKVALQTAQYEFASDPECRAFLLHAGSAAAGLTLVAAHTVIIVEPLVNPAIELQAVGRVRRIGQALPTKGSNSAWWGCTSWNTADPQLETAWFGDSTRESMK